MRRARGTSLATFVAFALAGAAVALALSPGRDASRDADTVAERLTRDFRGAYPLEARPSGKIVDVEIVAAPAEIAWIDGRRLAVWAYNGTVPGPEIRLRLGDTLRARFTNRLSQPTTIHWHGVRLPNAMDGVPHVTQPPVLPGESFTYEFMPKDAGTFWFHPHLRSSEQVERGLYGVLVVEDREPRPYSRDIVWVLDDWLLDRDGCIHDQFNTRHDLAHDGRWGNVATVNGTVKPTLAVRPGERLRLRLLNSANGRVFAPDFAGLDGAAIAFDGMYAAEPLPVAGLELAPGNRVDLDLVVPRDAAGRRFTITDRFTRSPFPLAVIAVDGTAVETPTFKTPAAAHVPRWREASEPPVDARIALNARVGGPYGIEWTLNGAVMRHDADAHHPHEAPYSLRRGRWAKLRFANESARLHPMHIHGQFFKVLARDGQPVEERHWRDTVLVRPRETIDVGLVPLDLGRWMLHCHILEHAESGMMTLVEVVP
jgi:FtsP/CotA-like multicopper oxidase with cupredoxin domain